MDKEELMCAYAMGIVDDDEVIICMLPSYEERLLPRQTLDLEGMTKVQSRQHFRFELDNLPRLAEALLFPATVVLDNRMRCTGLECLCVVLKRLSYPCRFCDLQELFGKAESSLSRMFAHGVNHVHGRFGRLLDTLDHEWLTREELQSYAQAIYDKGAPYDRCVAFVDGTVSAICRPSENQRVVYNGHKRKHALKYQATGAPNGMILHLDGPIVGKRHDWRIFLESNLPGALRQKTQDVDWEFYIYGDTGYRSTAHLQAPFRTITCLEEANCNKIMSGLRVSVEHMIGKSGTLWAFLDFPKNQKVFLQPLGLYFRVAILLTNAHTCLYGSQTGMVFGLESPDLEVYFH